MAIDPVPDSATLSSEERWRRWQQRGRDRDARFMRNLRLMFWSALLAVIAVPVMVLLLR